MFVGTSVWQLQEKLCLASADLETVAGPSPGPFQFNALPKALLIPENFKPSFISPH